MALDAVDLSLLLLARGRRSFSGGHFIRTCAQPPCPGVKLRHFDFLKHLTQFECAIRYVYVEKRAGAEQRARTKERVKNIR